MEPVKCRAKMTQTGHPGARRCTVEGQPVDMSPLGRRGGHTSSTSATSARSAADRVHTPPDLRLCTGRARSTRVMSTERVDLSPGASTIRATVYIEQVDQVSRSSDAAPDSNPDAGGPRRVGRRGPLPVRDRLRSAGSSSTLVEGVRASPITFASVTLARRRGHARRASTPAGRRRRPRKGRTTSWPSARRMSTLRGPLPRQPRSTVTSCPRSR